MAEKGSCEKKQQKEESPELEETHQVTDCSQGRVVTSSGKLRPLTILSTESGYHEDTWEKEQPLQAISKMKEKMLVLCGSLEEFEEVMQMAMEVHNKGRREGRREAIGEVDKQKLVYLQMHEEVEDTLKQLEKLRHTLTTLMPEVCGETMTSPKEGVAWKRQQRTTSSSAEPVSPTSSCSGETRFDTADERREEPQSNAIPRLEQWRYLSSSDEERKCKANGLELHPRKMLASKKKKGKM